MSSLKESFFKIGSCGVCFSKDPQFVTYRLSRPSTIAGVSISTITFLCKKCISKFRLRLEGGPHVFNLETENWETLTEALEGEKEENE